MKEKTQTQFEMMDKKSRYFPLCLAIQRPKFVTEVALDIEYRIGRAYR